MAETVEMTLRLWTRMGPRNHVLDGVQITPCEGQLFVGQGASSCKVCGLLSLELCKNAELIEMSFGMWTHVGPRKHVLDWVLIGANCK